MSQFVKHKNELTPLASYDSKYFIWSFKFFHALDICVTIADILEQICTQRLHGRP